jgi:uncharacterized protein (DUF302 family)
MTTFTMSKVVGSSYEQVLAKLPELLKSEGFGVLTEIDVKETLKKKINVDFRRYKILGACNPPLAHRALSAEIEIGAMLPCNVVVYERDDGKTTVAAIDPTKTIAAAGVPGLQEVAQAVREKLARVLEKVS